MTPERMTASQIEWVKNFLKYFFEKKIIPMATELDLYTATFIAIKDIHPLLDPSPDALLAAARKSSVLDESVQKRYREVLERLLGLVSEGTSQAEIEKFLQEWKPNPNDPVN